MDPAQKKWLNNLIEHICDNFSFSVKENESLLRNNISHDEFIYKLIHSTGIVFGYPETFVFKSHNLSHEWNQTDCAKICLTESLLACYLYFNKQKIGFPVEKGKLKPFLFKAVESILEFYSTYKPEKKALSLSVITKIFDKDNSTSRQVEDILNQRIKPAGILDSKFWHGSYYNTFIFLDIIFYSDWLQNNESKLYTQRTLVQFEILKSIAVSITHGKKTPPTKEKVFFNFFLSNAVERTQIKQLDMLNSGHYTIKSINITSKYPQILKCIIFEYGIFTLMLDREIDQYESNYLYDLGNHLSLAGNQIELSILIVSSFIFRNINKVSYLKNRHKLDIISSNFYNKLSSLIIKNKGKIAREIGESKELAELLWKAKNTDLSDEEKEKVKNQLTDIFLRTIPSIAIFMIPGGSILLPLILKIIPEEILIPSSFRNK